MPLEISSVNCTYISLKIHRCIKKFFYYKIKRKNSNYSFSCISSNNISMKMKIYYIFSTRIYYSDIHKTSFGEFFSEKMCFLK